MAIYDKGFVNRSNLSINARVIDVTTQTIKANGAMQLKANISRDDDFVQVAGTKLDAAGMNKAVLDLVYNDLFGIQVSEDLHAIEIVADEQFTFTITCNERPVFVNCVCDSSIEFDGSNDFYDTGATITVILSADTTLLTTESEIPFKIELYTDMQRRNYLVSVTGIIHYFPTSQSSND